jgi:predicted  nucleic acid-binding Zn-ribbon protein
VPGEDELPVEAPPGESAAAAARLDVVAARMETLGAALQRGVADATESMATLSRSVGTVSSEMAGLVHDAVEALGRTRRIVNGTDQAMATLVASFGQVEERVNTLAEELADVVQQQRQLESKRLDPDELGAAVGSEVASALTGFADRFEEQVAALATEMRDERTDLAHRLRDLADPSDPLDAADVRAAVQGVVETVTATAIDRLRADVERLVGEVHEDRALLFKRLAGSRELDEVKQAVTALVSRGDVVDLQAAIEDGLAAQSEQLAELGAALAGTATGGRDGAALERLRTDIQALAEDLTTTAKRALAGQRAIEGLKTHLGTDLPADLRDAVAGAAAEVRGETESLVGELHDDLGLVMRQVVAGNEELEQIRAAVEALQTQARPEPATKQRDVAEELAPALTSVRDDLIGAVTELHGDLALVLTRLAAGQRDLDEVRQAVVDAVVDAVAPAAAGVDGDALATTISGNLAAPLSELGDDLSVLVRSASATQDDIEQLRGELAELAAAVAEATAASELSDDEGEESYDEDQGPDLLDVLEALRGDVEAGIGAVASDLKDELDSLRDLIVPQPSLEPGDVRSEIEGVMADVRDDLAMLARHVLAAQEEVTTLRADVLDAVSAETPAPPAVAPELLDATEDVRAAVDTLGEDLRTQFERLRKVLARPRPEAIEPPALDSAAVAAAVEPVVADLHDDLAQLAGQLTAAQDALEELRTEALAALTAPPVPPADVEGAVADLHEDLSVVLGQVVSGQEELRAIREDVAAGREDLRVVREELGVVPAELAALRDDMAVVPGELAVVRDEVGALPAEMAALRDEVGALPAEMAALRDEVAAGTAEVTAVRDEVAATAGELVAIREDVTAIAAPADLGAVYEVLSASSEDMRAVLDAVNGLSDDLPALLRSLGPGGDDLNAVIDAVAAGHSEMAALRDEVAVLLEVAGQAAAPGSAATLDLEVAIADLPAVLSSEIRAEFEIVAADLRAGLDHLRELVDLPQAAAPEPAPAADLEGLREDLQVLVNELHDDLGTLMGQVLTGQDEVSALRVELADAVADAGQPASEDSTVALDELRVDVTAGLADLSVDLRTTVEALVADLHDDLAGLMSQIVAGQDDLDALRQLLADAAGRPGQTDQVAADLDRLGRDLQSLRERLPGPPPAARKRRP